jgi:hypothetical protein
MKRSLITSVAASVAAVAMLSPAAQAGDWNGRRHPGYGHYQPAPQYYVPPPRYNHFYHERRRDRTGEKIAKGVAIGVGALILGSILANEARRHDRGY